MKINNKLKNYILYGKYKFIPTKLKKIMVKNYFNKLLLYLSIYLLIDCIILLYYQIEIYLISIMLLLLIKNLLINNTFYLNLMIEELIVFLYYKLFFVNSIKVMYLFLFSLFIWNFDNNLLINRLLNIINNNKVYNNSYINKDDILLIYGLFIIIFIIIKLYINKTIINFEIVLKYYWIYKLFFNTFKILYLILISFFIKYINIDILLNKIIIINDNYINNNLNEFIYSGDKFIEINNDYIEINNDPYIGLYIFKYNFLTIKDYSIKIKINYTNKININRIDIYNLDYELIDIYYTNYNKKNILYDNLLINKIGLDVFSNILFYLNSNEINKIFKKNNNKLNKLLKKLLLFFNFKYI